MPVNKKENLVYTFLMVTVMASIMTTYNISMNDELSIAMLKKAWLVFPFTFTIAFIVEWFFVGKTAPILIGKLLKADDPLPKKILVASLCFVVQMVIIMSTIGMLLFSEPTSNWFADLIRTMGRNFLMAFPLQVLIAGPLVGMVFRKLFPLGTIVVPNK